MSQQQQQREQLQHQQFTMTATASIPSTMAAVHLTRLGGPEVLVYRTDVPVPTPDPHQVLVRVGAAGVNNTDVNTRIGWYGKDGKQSTAEMLEQVHQNGQEADGTWQGQGMRFPRIQGADLAGTIVAVGSQVDPTRVGQRVLVDPCPLPARPDEIVSYLGSESDGAFGQFCVVPAQAAHVVTHSRLTDVELATFPCSYSTAENALTRCHCQANDVVLVTGASGGVGSAAVQLAKRRGATVIAVCGASKADKLKQIGADRVVDRQANLVQVLGVESVTLVYDVVGGPTWPRYLELLQRRGRYCTSGAIAGPIVELDLRTLYLKDLTLMGTTALDEGVFANLVRYINDGEIKPLVAGVYPLKEIVQAQEAFVQKKHVGKMVLVPPATLADTTPS